MTTIPASQQALAIHGGPSVRRALLPYGRQSVDESDIQAVVDVLLRLAYHWSQGGRVRRNGRRRCLPSDSRS
jgi:hypothetical protein